MTLTLGAGSNSTSDRLRKLRKDTRSNSTWPAIMPRDRPRIERGAPRAGAAWRPRAGEPRSSNPHRHDHGHVARAGALAAGLEQRRIQIPADAQDDLVVVDGREHVQEVARVEADRHLGAGVLARDLVEALAALGALRFEADRVAAEGQLHASG